MSPKQQHALKLICDSVVAAVAEASDLGAPGGVLFAAMNAQGCSLDQFEKLMDALVGIGKLRREGDLYFVAQPAHG